jgi:CHASE3 domain sensor protein
MRSRAVRLSCVAVAWIALGVTAYLVIRAEQQLAARRADRRAFDVQARDITAALTDLRSAQQAYVAAGQGVAFWSPKVVQAAEAIRASVGVLRASATDAASREAIDEITSALARFDDLNARALDYLRSGQVLMASDIIFSEGGQLTASAAADVSAARFAEAQSLESLEAAARQQEAIALAVAGSATAIIALVLALTAGTPREVADMAPLSVVPHARNDSSNAVSGVPQPVPIRTELPVLRTAAQLCTDFACMQDVNDLQLLLTRAGDVMDAAGLIVWIGNSRGDDLQPVLSHGYSPETRARLPNVPRSANNAAAAAYRSGDLQIVLSRPGGSKGAIVAPIRGAHGCVGALSVEIRGGGDASESVQSLATIVAAQLAGVLSTPHSETGHSDTRAAVSS